MQKNVSSALFYLQKNVSLQRNKVRKNVVKCYI